MATVIPDYSTQPDPGKTFRETAELVSKIMIERDRNKIMAKQADNEATKMKLQDQADSLDALVKGYEYVQKMTPKLKASGVKDDDIPSILNPVASTYFRKALGSAATADYVSQVLKDSTDKMQPDPQDLQAKAIADAYGKTANELGFDQPGGQPPMPSPGVPREAALLSAAQGGSPTMQAPTAPAAPVQSPVSTMPAVTGAQGTMMPESQTLSYGGKSVTYKMQKTPEQMAAEANAEATKQARAALQKSADNLKGTTDTAAVAMGVTLDAWFNNMKYNYEELGLEPGGIIGGAGSRLAGTTRLNPYWEGFNSMLIEAGASIARMAMPGTRAMFAVEMFKKTLPGDFSTLESGIENTVVSYKDAVARTYTNPIVQEEAIANGDLPKNYNELSHPKKMAALMDATNRDGDVYSSEVWNRAYNSVPDLVPESKKRMILKERAMNKAMFDKNPGGWQQIE